MSYQILYLPNFTGRAEPAMLLLEDAGQPYDFVAQGRERIATLALEHPVFAPPVLVDGDTVISQTNVIVDYLGRKHGYAVSANYDIAAAQLAYNIADIWREIYVGRKNNDTEFFQQRFPRWMALLENSFSGATDEGFFFSPDAPTYVDFLAFNIATLADYCWGPAATAQINALPRLGAWVQRMRSRPRIKAYLDNPDSLPVGHEAVRGER